MKIKVVLVITWLKVQKVFCFVLGFLNLSDLQEEVHIQSKAVPSCLWPDCYIAKLVA